MIDGTLDHPFVLDLSKRKKSMVLYFSELFNVIYGLVPEA
jgi:hypothetical protein